MTATHTAPADPRRRIGIMIGVGMALGVVLFLVTRTMAGGGDTGEVAAVGATPTAAAPTTTTTVAAAPAQSTVETFEVFTTKNPFMPLRSAAPAAPAATAGATRPAAAAPAPAPAPAPTASGVAATPVSTGGASTGTTSGTAAAPAPTKATGGQAAEPSRSSIRVALLDVFAENGRTVANVRVNDTVSKVAAGDTFASNFKAVSLDPAERCGRFLYGDDQFRLCKGEEVLK